MSQASIVLPEASTVTGIAMTKDVDAALAAISTLNAGATDPGTGPGAYALWADTGSNKLKQRNADNSAWVALCDLAAALAALAGNASQTFSVANAVANEQAVNLGQLQAAIDTATAVAAAAAAKVASNPTGTIISSACAAAPSGYLLCNGNAVSRSDYAALFTAIGTAYGVGDGSSTFNIPDARGLVLRGADSGRDIDSGRALGSYQSDAIASHAVSISDPGHSHTLRMMAPGGGYKNYGFSGVGYNSTIGGGPDYTFTTSGPTNASGTGISASYSGASETRMKNLAVNFFIKF